VAVLIAVEAVALAVLGLLVAGLLRSHADILRFLRDLDREVDPGAERGVRSHSRAAPVHDAGSPAADVVGATPTGDAITIGVVGTDEGTLLAFLTSGCLSCHLFWKAFDRRDLAVPGDARLVIVTRSAEHESESQLAALAPRDVPVVMSNEAWETYEVRVAPYFVYVDGRSGRIVGEGAAGTWEHVSDLMHHAIADAGLGQGSRRRPRLVPDVDRGARVDRDLASAGIRPGHDSLYRSPVPRDESPSEEAGSESDTWPA
jgi:hypothetical protein